MANINRLLDEDLLSESVYRKISPYLCYGDFGFNSNDSYMNIVKNKKVTIVTVPPYDIFLSDPKHHYNLKTMLVLYLVRNLYSNSLVYDLQGKYSLLREYMLVKCSVIPDTLPADNFKSRAIKKMQKYFRMNIDDLILLVEKSKGEL